MKPVLRILLPALLCVLLVSACGKKGPVRPLTSPPPAEESRQQPCCE